MHYKQLRALYNNRHAVFSLHNSADGTSNDNSTDPIVKRDPNNYLVPKINGFTVSNTLQIAVGILAVIILLPMAVKSIKSLL